MKIRRVGAYGVCRDGLGRVLLARNSALSSFPGLWTLPGGGVDQGEHPDDAVVREFAEETGLDVRADVIVLREVLSDVARLPSGDLEHTDRVVYDVSVTGGTLRAEIGGTTDLVEWRAPADIEGLPLMPFTARVLGLSLTHPVTPASMPQVAADVPLTPIAPESATASTAGAALGEPTAGAPAAGVPEMSDKGTDGPRAFQRFGAYAAATDPEGRMLLSRISEGYPGAGMWHLPGGGTDHGESPEEALHREIWEETSQHGRVTGLLGVSHRYDPKALGPEGVPVDWHVIRVLFRVHVDLPTEPVVTEEAGGSTADAAWFTSEEAGGLELTELARAALAGILLETAR
jgi:8-oxo-dGTP diphosphatase